MNLRIAIVLVLLAAGCSSSKPIGPMTRAADLEKRVLEFYAAAMAKDIQKMESIMAPGYTLYYTTPNFELNTLGPVGVPHNRMWLRDWLPQLQLQGSSFAWSVTEVMVHRDIGITVSHYHWQGTFKGLSFDYEGYVSDIWIQNDGQWFLLKSAATAVPPRY